MPTLSRRLAGIGAILLASSLLAPSAAGAEAPDVDLGRLIRATASGIELVDWDGTSVSPIAQVAPGCSDADALAAYPRTGLFLWSEQCRVSDDAIHSVLHVARFDGREVRRFTLDGPYWVWSAAMSPDGRTAYVAKDGGPQAPDTLVQRIDLTQPAARPVDLYRLPGLAASSLTTSPDGRWLAFDTRNRRTGTLKTHVARTDGSQDRRLLPPPGYWHGRFDTLLWSPDSTRLAVSLLSPRSDHRSEDLVIRTVVGGDGYRYLTSGASGWDRFESWSADGSTLIVADARWGYLPNGRDTSTGAWRQLGASGLSTGLPSLADDPPDTTPPTVAVLPAYCFAQEPCTPAERNTVRAWSYVRGRAADTGGSGLRDVGLVAVERVAGAWWAYTGAGTWVRRDTRVLALEAAVAQHAYVNTTDPANWDPEAWSVGLDGLRAGRLHIIATARDWAGNSSTPARWVVDVT